MALELVERFNRQGDVLASLHIAHQGARLAVRIEDQLLRILQDEIGFY